MNELRVYVFQFGSRDHLRMQYADPATGKKITRTTGETNRRKALAVAAVWQDELRTGRFQSPSKVTWAEFRDRYENEVLPGLAPRTGDKVCGVFNVLERAIAPRMLRDVTGDRLSTLQAKLRDEVLRADRDATGKVVRVHRRSENTIAGHLAHLRSALQWAVGVGMLAAVPKIVKPKRARTASVMKGRPITGEEFDRMLAKTAAVVGAEAAASWQYFLTGLWLSGLRLKESLDLYWVRDDKLCVDLSGKRPMLRIPAALEKGNRDRLLPIAPDFAAFLLRTPEAQRTGPVFMPGPQRYKERALLPHRVGRIISAIGKVAGVVVNTGSRKFASAHDLRRSFGERWAAKLMPQVLRDLMRHESIETTMRYYVGRNAETTADAVWQAYGSGLANGLANGQPNAACGQSERNATTANASRG
jgi:integrase